jgi:hypothetical protein
MTETESEGLILTRRHVAIPLLILQLYPIQLVWTAYRQVPKFMMIFEDLLGPKMSLPQVTQLLHTTYRWWVVVPVLTLGLAAACLHPKVKTMGLPMLTLALTLVLSFIMRTVLVEGNFAPLIMTISQLSE